MKQRVFWVRSPTLPILDVEAEIVSGPKMTWAVLKNGKRGLLGVRAFFTLASAETRKLGLLRKIAENPILARMPQTWRVYDEATQQIREYQRDKRFKLRRVA